MEKWASQGHPRVFVRVSAAGCQRGREETKAWVLLTVCGARK